MPFYRKENLIIKENNINITIYQCNGLPIEMLFQGSIFDKIVTLVN